MGLTDERLDDFRDTTERRLENLEAFQRMMGQIPGLMEAIREGQERQDDDIRALRVRMDTRFDRSDDAHHNIAYGKDPDDPKKSLPPQPAVLTWGTIGRMLTGFAGIVALIVVPFLLAGGHP